MVVAGAQSFAQDSEDRDMDSFNRITLKGSFDVIVRVGAAQRVELTGDADYFDDVETRVRRNTLIISWDRNGLGRRFHNDVGLEISVPSLIGFNIAGSGDVEIGDIDSEVFTINIAGSGDIFATGRCVELEINIAGSGEVEGEDLICEDVSIDISGSGDVEITATASIKADINGSGDITVYGSPSGIRLRQRGSGDIEIVDER